MSLPNELESQMIANSLSKILNEIPKDLVNQLSSMLASLMKKEEGVCKEMTGLYSEYQKKAADFEREVNLAKAHVKHCQTDTQEIFSTLQRNASPEIIQRHLLKSSPTQ